VGPHLQLFIQCYVDDVNVILYAEAPGQKTSGIPSLAAMRTEWDGSSGMLGVELRERVPGIRAERILPFAGTDHADANAAGIPAATAQPIFI